MRNKYVFIFLLLLMLSVVSFGIVKMAEIEPSGKEGLLVVTSFYPVNIATKNIAAGIDEVTIQNLTEPSTGCLHDYQLSTKDMKMLEKADLFIVNGGGMEGFLDDVLKQFPDLKIVEATEGIELLSVSSADNHDEIEENHIHEEEHEDAHVHEAEEEHVHEAEDVAHTHVHGDENAHVWMNIDYYEKQLENIAHALIEADPKQQVSCYEENLQYYKEKLNSLKKIAEDIASNDYKKVVLFHDAFAYTAQMCGLEVAETINMDEETSLSAAQIGHIIDLVKQEDVRYLLADETYGKKAAEAVAKETEVEIVYLDTLVSGEYDNNAYIRGMEKNLESLKEGLQ